MSDVWEWKILEKSWYFVKGSKYVEEKPSYQKTGPYATPGGRAKHAMTIDQNSGDIYIFGGTRGQNQGKKHNLLKRFDNKI